MPDDRLTQDELAVVLRRAAEIDSSSALPEFDDRVPVAAVEAGAAEVGLAPAAVRQAVAELRAGMLGETARNERRRVVIARVVPRAADDALHEVRRFLAGQFFVKARDRGGVQVWRQREDFLAQLLRGFDWAARFRLKPLDELGVRAVEVEGGTLVRFEATLRAGTVYAPRLIGGGLAAAGIAGGAVALALGEPAVAMWSASTAAVTGGTGYAISRTNTRSSVNKATEAIEGFLDDLERNERPRSSRFRR